MSQIATVALLGAHYDQAIDFFTGALGFQLREDTALGPGKRWVVVAPPSGGSAALLLAKAANDEQRKAVGRQAGGRVGFFLETEDFATDHRRMTEAGVRFLEPPRSERYGTVAVFEDLYGNRWDLLQPAIAAVAPANPPR